jgi:1,4-dihydroxy-2-naphthoate octaprenyltransferase
MSETLAVVRASRPNFLILAPLCVGLGVAVVWQTDPSAIDTMNLLLVFAGGLLAHAAVNLFNEYQDFTSGLDLTTERTPFSGGSGALPETPQAARSVLLAAYTTLGLVLFIGGWFLWLRGWPMLLTGATGTLLVLTYTQWLTRRPLLCLMAPGLGFGPVMVLGTIVALGGPVNSTALCVSLVAWMLVSELLLINQIPDETADRQAGRRHLVITMGARTGSRLVAILLLGSYLPLILGVALSVLPSATLLALLTLPASLWISRALPVSLGHPTRLNRVLGTNVAVLLSTLMLVITGIIL